MRSARRTFVGVVALLAAFNGARALGAFGGASDLAAVALGVVVALLAWQRGLTAADVGVQRDRLGSGARWGGAAFALVLLVLLVAALVPATSGAFDDDRADLSLAGLVATVLGSILVATVLPEELAFRGVLLGAGARGWSTRTAVVASSVLFGLWHVGATLSTSDDNQNLDEVTSSGAGTAGVVAGAVLLTTVAGFVFCWLRLRSRSLLAPVLAHLGTNSVALVVAWALR